MRNVFMLAAANIRKSKSQTTSLLAFVLIAAALLYVGLVLLFGIGKFYDEKGEEAHAPHVYVLASPENDWDATMRYIENYPGVAETEAIQMVGGMGQFTAGPTTSTGYIFFSRVSDEQKMDAPMLLDTVPTVAGETSLPLQGDAIYVPGFMLESDGGKVGEEFKTSLNGVDLSFTIAGATEEISFGSPMNTVYRLYVPDERFDEILAAMPQAEIVMMAARIEDYNEARQFQQNFSSDMPQEGALLLSSYLTAKQARTAFPTIIAVVVAAFAAILLGVSLIVIRFRIGNNIEEGMTNIGALKAVGYKSGQISGAMVLQFGTIALLGGLVGLVIAQLMLPTVAGILRPQLSLEWAPNFDLSLALISLGLVFFTVLLITFLSAHKIKKLHPLTALRGGITTHNFKRNPLPLEKARAPLSLLLALKTLLKNKRQAAMMTVIMAAISVAVVMSLSVHYGMNVNRDTFARSFFGEIPDASLILKSGEDTGAFASAMKAHPDVRKVNGFESGVVSLQIDGTDNNPNVVEDILLLEGNMLIDGAYPRYANEIAIGSATAETLGKGPGDIVLVEADGNGVEKEFIVSGVVQYTNYNGFNGLITGEALRELLPNYTFYGYNIYLNAGVNIDAFIEEVKVAEGDIFMSTSNTLAMIDGMLESMGGIIEIVAVAVVAITFVIILLALHLVIKTTIIRRRRELGIQKALGFTTRQLMNQTALNFTPAILLGVALGSVGGAIGFSPFVSAMMRGMGIVKAELPIPTDWLVIAGAALIVLTYGISMLVSVRIRKISAYGLVSE